MYSKNKKLFFFGGVRKKKFKMLKSVTKVEKNAFYITFFILFQKLISKSTTKHSILSRFYL